jgi:hypothetical protein
MVVATLDQKGTYLFKKWGKMGCLRAAEPPANTPPPNLLR